LSGEELLEKLLSLIKSKLLKGLNSNTTIVFACADGFSGDDYGGKDQDRAGLIDCTRLVSA
jgi:hypothetical protein